MNSIMQIKVMLKYYFIQNKQDYEYEYKQFTKCYHIQ